MIKLNFFITLIFIATISLSQKKSLKYVNSDNVWQYSVYGFGVPFTFYQNTFSKDSLLIGGKYYFERQLINSNIQLINKYYREDNGKVFILKGQNEVLIYDFSLKIGDTFSINHTTKAKVSRLENIITADGLTRKKITVDVLCGFNTFIQNIWIQGIGEVKGDKFINNACFAFDPEPSLDCFLQDNKIVYSLKGCQESYKKLVSEELIWQVNVTKQAETDVTERFYKFDSPIIINNKTYSELLKAEGPSFKPANWAGTSMFFREENGVVFYLDNDEEIQYFDFNLNKGDEFKLPYEPTTSVYVIKKDSIIFGIDIKTRKVIQLACDSLSDNNNITWVEGIGDKSSFIFSNAVCSLFDPSETVELKCVFYANSFRKIYGKDFTQDCYLDSDFEKNTIDQKEIKIYPNPASDVLRIEFQKQFSGVISIYDHTLREVFKQDIKENSYGEKLDISILKSGIYIILFKENDGNTSANKIIIL